MKFKKVKPRPRYKQIRRLIKNSNGLQPESCCKDIDFKYHSWVIDCGSQGTMSVSCEEGKKFGFSYKGIVYNGFHECTTTTSLDGSGCLNDVKLNKIIKA
tara:strand:- start:25 stop:324 length:300 start_codon:yes stop_codon:yes gene_type:complete